MGGKHYITSFELCEPMNPDAKPMVRSSSTGVSREQVAHRLVTGIGAREVWGLAMDELVKCLRLIGLGAASRR